MGRLSKLIALACVFYLFAGCSARDTATKRHSGNAITDTVITSTYPDLYQAVFSRDDAKLLQFVKNVNPQVRRQAWRALAQTPVDSLPAFIQKVKQAGSQEAWFALSMHDLSPQQLRDVEQYWIEQSAPRKGISLVIGQQGDEQTLVFLMNHLNEITGREYEPEVALAVSRLMIRFEATENQQRQIINAAFSGNDAKVIHPWLYGFYRGNSQQITSALQDSLYKRWKSFGIGTDAGVDQYIANIVGLPAFSEIIRHYAASSMLNAHVQLGIELAQLVDDVELNDEMVSHVEKLLNHPSPHVVQLALANLAGSISSGDPLYVFIQTQIMDDDQTPPFVWLQALNTLAEAEPKLVQKYSERLNAFSETHPYLYPQILDAWIKGESSSAFLKRINETVAEGDPLKSMYAINALNDFWSAAENKSQIKTEVRNITFDALAMADRGVTFSTQPLLQDSVLFEKNDFTRINRYLNSFSLPGDIEVYQTFGSLYKQRFEKQALTVIDSLIALGYVPLNRSLKQAGWEVEVPNDFDTKFKTPDWNRIWELGERPVWVLETEKGTIKVQMNSLSAPATVSTIDSLTRAGAYDDVPFHRVVPNFVIQGGDIKRRDGFGGPDFTIPTEANEQGFGRGAAGIASAGPDTEGSQYFFMHQWKPHLNGRYTLFGNVIEGMSVVDKIIVGDKVERAYWE